MKSASMTRSGIILYSDQHELQYVLGKGFSGLFRAWRLRRHLCEDGFRVESQGHVTPREIPSDYPFGDPAQRNPVVVGFLYRHFFSGYHFFVENLDDRRVTRYTRQLKDLCDALE